MALSDSAVSELIEVFRAGEGTDFIRECVRVVMQELIDAETTAAVGAGRYERTQSRVTVGFPPNRGGLALRGSRGEGRGLVVDG